MPPLTDLKYEYYLYTKDELLTPTLSLSTAAQLYFLNHQISLISPWSKKEKLIWTRDTTRYWYFANLIFQILHKVKLRLKDNNQTVHEKPFLYHKKKVFADFWITLSPRGVRSSYLVTLPVITFTFIKNRIFFMMSTFFVILTIWKSSKFTNLTKICEKTENFDFREF